MSEWISVEDQLPDDTNLKVIRYSLKGKHMGISLSHYWHPSNMQDGYLMWDFEFGNTQGTKVTHWMPLPPPPKM